MPPQIPANAERRVNRDGTITYNWCRNGLFGEDLKTKEEGCWRW